MTAKRMVIMVRNSFYASEAAAWPAVQSFMSGHEITASSEDSKNSLFKTIERIGEDGPMLVEMEEESVANVLAADPSLQIVPLIYYETADQRSLSIKVPAFPVANGGPQIGNGFHIYVVDNNGQGVPGAKVAAFTDFKGRSGADGTSDARGCVNLAFPPGGGIQIERLYIYPPSAGYWTTFQPNITMTSGGQFKLLPCGRNDTDSLSLALGAPAKPTDGQGVVVGVIDTGVWPHQDLPNVIGAVPSHAATGNNHGTHVAGIIAGKVRGVAPGATIRSYQVFFNGNGADNYTIAKAIDQAVKDGCHLINMSLSTAAPNPADFSIDPLIQQALKNACDKGVLAVSAAGNDYRSAVDFPARDPSGLGITAFGNINGFPRGTSDDLNVQAPFGANANDFIAAFSNFGSEADLTAPGVGIISTVPGNGYAPMSGTSMACPAATGLAARWLSRNPYILGMPRNRVRTDAMMRLVLSNARSKGFPVLYEGRGMIAP